MINTVGVVDTLESVVGVLIPVGVNTRLFGGFKHLFVVAVCLGTSCRSRVEVYGEESHDMEFLNTLEFEGPSVGLPSNIRHADGNNSVWVWYTGGKVPVTIKKTFVFRSVEFKGLGINVTVVGVLRVPGAKNSKVIVNQGFVL